MEVQAPEKTTLRRQRAYNLAGQEDVPPLRVAVVSRLCSAQPAAATASVKQDVGEAERRILAAQRQRG